MLEYAVIIFLVAAALGLIMADMLFEGKMAPWPLSILHMLLDATGLACAGFVAMTIGGGILLTALICLLGAAVGGFYPASIHLPKEVAPRAVAVAHVIMAVGGMVLLLAAAAMDPHA